jgi:hypothetical protein
VTRRERSSTSKNAFFDVEEHDPVRAPRRRERSALAPFGQGLS